MRDRVNLAEHTFGSPMCGLPNIPYWFPFLVSGQEMVVAYPWCDSRSWDSKPQHSIKNTVWKKCGFYAVTKARSISMRHLGLGGLSEPPHLHPPATREGTGNMDQWTVNRHDESAQETWAFLFYHSGERKDPKSILFVDITACSPLGMFPFTYTTESKKANHGSKSWRLWVQVRLTVESNLLHVPICFWSMGIGDCITLFWGHWANGCSESTIQTNLLVC